MTFSNFIIASRRTEPKLPNQEEYIKDYTLGLVGETIELLESYLDYSVFGEDKEFVNKIIEESGDVLWYIASLFTHLGINDSVVSENSLNNKLLMSKDIVSQIVISAGKVSEIVKKHYYHHLVMDMEKITYYLSNIVKLVSSLVISYGVSLSSTMEQNYNKLTKRYFIR